MNNHNSGSQVDLVLIALVILRVLIVLGIWLALFLALFFGYFTVPIILLGIITVFYALSDIGVFVLFRRRKITDLRKSMLSALDEQPHLENPPDNN
jgi:hypothetical protein